MKRLSIVGLMLASAFALTNCSQEIVPPIQENDVIVDESIKEDTTPEEVVSIPFEVYANPSAETRTAHDSENNGTKWSANDTINVYHSVHNRNSYKNNHAFIIADVEKGLFGGGLTERLASGTYDWCFLYPYDKSRGNTTTTTVQMGATKGTDGAYVQRLTNGAGSKEHIAGTLFPMYGHASGISADQNPKVQMRHMSAIVALKIVNQGDSKKENLEQEKNDSDKRQIVINDITFAVPAYSTSAISQKAIPIVGSFNVDPTNDINSASFTPVTGASSNSVKLEFASTKIDPGASATFYLAVRPFDVSNSVLGGSEKRTGLTLSITINGSTRSVEIPAGTKFEAGKVTTLRVPVKLSYPKVSDALDAKSNGENILTMPVPETNLQVNGESVGAYIVGSDQIETLEIKGMATDLFKALDAGFYASTWDGKPAAMTVSNIHLWINGQPFNEYKDLKDALVKEIKRDHWLLYTNSACEIAVSYVMGKFDNGVPRDDEMIHLTQFIDPQTITFNGVVTNGSIAGENIFILDEEPIYKGIDAAAINNLLLTRFEYNGKIPTYEGLSNILTGNIDDSATATAEILYNKLRSSFLDRGVLNKTLDIPLIGEVSVSITMVTIFDAIFKSSADLISKLQTLKARVQISTCPFHADKAKGYGTKASPISLNNIQGDKNPIIFWGLDAYGPDKSSL